MNLKDQLAIQKMYNSQINASKSEAQKKDDEIKALNNKIRQQNHKIKGTHAAKVGKN